MFTDAAQIVVALGRARDSFDPRSSSLLVLTPRPNTRTGEPFRTGFLSGIEERGELMRLLRILPEQQRSLLIMWFAEGRPVAQIARKLQISRVHCYRLKERAIAAMIAASKRPARDEGTGTAG